MGVQVAGSCLRLPTATTTPTVSPSFAGSSSSSSSQIVAALFSPRSSKRKGAVVDCSDLSAAYRLVENRSPFLGTGCGRLYRSRSLELANGGRRQRKQQSLRRAVSAGLESCEEDDEEFVKRIQELVVGLGDYEAFNLNPESMNHDSHTTNRGNCDGSPYSSPSVLISDSKLAQPWRVSRLESSEWPEVEAMVMPGNLERNANSVDLPVSLRILKRKKQQQMLQWEEGFREAGECACCSVNKAFSSMVFIIRELHSYTLQMRHSLFYEDLQGILARVQQEMHTSFVWLFQQIFSCTPTLMISVMLLLANFTVYSMDHNLAVAAPMLAQSAVAAVVENNFEQKTQPRFDPASVNTFSPGRAASVGGSIGGGGGKVRPVAGATDDGRWEGSSPSSQTSRPVIPDGMAAEECCVAMTEEEEMEAWSNIVEEASEMQASTTDDSLMDRNTFKWMVPPVLVEMEAEDCSNYLQTELRYQQALAEDPENTLLLANFAQFLYAVLHDNDRAEEYFKRAVEVKPADAEALNKYATFLWIARKDLTAAEETYLDAIAADPANSFYAANYAHFLWNTGGEDTCFPLYG